MHTIRPSQLQLPDPSTVNPVREPPNSTPVPASEPYFPEREDDPQEAEELERQQDA